MKFKTLSILISTLLITCAGMSQNLPFSSNLPIVYIDTYGGEIKDSPRIKAGLEIAWKENGDQNSTSDPRNHFKGDMKIEFRGSSSQMFPKKSYGFELKDELGEDMDFPLLGMPEEEDWILYAPYSDKTLIRNVLTFSLAGQIGGVYTPRCRFVELFVNEKYDGVYVLMEQIKRDSSRVDIAKLKESDIEGEELTGGYIIKIDKTTGGGGDGWNSQFYNKNGTKTFYQYDYPNSDKIQPEQKDYIRNYVSQFETAVYNNNRDEEKGYPSYINPVSFYDFIVMNELSKNVDGYRLSTYLFKDKNEKLTAGPLWDFNLAYGNANYHQGWETHGLQVNADLGNDYWQIPFWWQNLMEDSYFVDRMKCRFEDLRENQLSDERINAVTDSLINFLGTALDRNFDRWPVLGEWVWPNYYVGSTYESEISWMRNWITERTRHLDFVLPGDCITNLPSISKDFDLRIFPSPFAERLTVQVQSESYRNYNFLLYNLNGQIVLNTTISATIGLNTVEVSGGDLRSGVFIYKLFDGTTELSVGKIVKL